MHVLDAQRATLANESGVAPFARRLADAGHAPLRRAELEILQLNVGKLCNQTCAHCHVDAGPDRKEVMTRATMEQCLAALDRTAIHTVDITGGAPELNPDFRWLVMQARSRGKHVIDRCNLTILTIASQRDLVEFLAANQVEVVASLPYFLAERTNAQRGDGVFERSIAGLQKLNAAGYGRPDSSLALNLVFNPSGAFLPPKQAALEADFRRELRRRHGAEFNRLYTLTNLPISRFLEFLLETGNYAQYMERLANAFNPATVAGLMCRNTLSVAWDGELFDCDFNQMLELPPPNGAPRHIRDFDPAALDRAEISIGQHCYGCTAGAGSSCGGALA